MDVEMESKSVPTMGDAGSSGTMGRAEKEDATFATLLINDALQRETSNYYQTDDGKAASVWERGGTARKLGLVLRRESVITFLSGLALFDMLLAVFSQPNSFVKADWINNASVVMQIMIWIFNCILCLVRMKFMWGSRRNWFKGAQEPPWVVVHFVVLFVLTTVEWVIYYTTDHEWYLQTDGDYVNCPPSASVFIHGWARAWMWIYFNRGVRDALTTLLRVFTRLGPVSALLLACFFSHFFIFQGLAVGETKYMCPTNGTEWLANHNAGISGYESYSQPSGVSAADSGCQGFGPGGNTWDAMYNLFGLLTTVNHPDVMMWLVDRKWYTFIFIFTYMFSTNIIGLNLLLAIVYGEYVTILEDTSVRKAELRKCMMNTAFDILDPDNDGHLTPKQVIDMVKQSASSMHQGGTQDMDYNELIVRCIDNKKGQENEEGNVPDLDSGTVSREDLQELLVFFSAPVTIKSQNKPSMRYELELKALEDRLSATQIETERESTQALINHMKSISVHQWCAKFPELHYWVFEFGSGHQGFIEDDEACCYEYWPLQNDSYFCQIHTLYFLFYLALCTFNTSSSDTSSSSKCFLFFSCLYQLVYFVIMFFASMRPWQTFHFFNPNSKEAIAHVCVVGLLVCLWIEFFANCNETSCFDRSERTASSSTLITAAAVSKIFQVMSYSVETPSVHLLFHAIQKTLPTLGPHFGLFLAIYYGFAGMGLAFFCGAITEVSSEGGGPGTWGAQTYFAEDLLGPNQGIYTYYPMKDVNYPGQYYARDYCQPCCTQCDATTDIYNASDQALNPSTYSNMEWCTQVGSLPNDFSSTDRTANTGNCSLTSYWSSLSVPGASTASGADVPRGNLACVATDHSINGNSNTCQPGEDPNLGNSYATDQQYAMGSPYYFNLNYNGFAQAIGSLYVVTIQNNWNVAAAVAVDSQKSRGYRWYFFIFTIVNAFVMINVLVGAIIDALDAVRQDSLRKAAGDPDPLEHVITERINSTVGPSGNYYGVTWELGDMPLHGEIRYDAQLCPELFETEEEVLQGEISQLEDDIKSTSMQIEQAKAKNHALERKIEAASPRVGPKSVTPVI